MAAAHLERNDLAEGCRRITTNRRYMKRAGHRFEVVDSVEAAISVLVAWRGVGCGEGNGAMQ